MLWITILFVLCSFAVLDAGAVAWSASFVTGHQLVAVLLTLIAVEAGALVTLWRMRA